jgi:DNA-directed RNA polymerase subunit H
MHILQPKHIKLKPKEAQELLKKYNISLAQLPKVKSTDPAMPEGCTPGEVIKVERKDGEMLNVYFRVVA